MGNTTSELQQATDEVQQEVEQQAAAVQQEVGFVYTHAASLRLLRSQLRRAVLLAGYACNTSAAGIHTSIYGNLKLISS